MKPKLYLSKILPRQKIKYLGDLYIHGDVGNGAEVIVLGGSLTICGNVGVGAKIFVNVSKLRRADFLTSDYSPRKVSGDVDRKINYAASMAEDDKEKKVLKLWGQVAIEEEIFTRGGEVTYDYSNPNIVCEICPAKGYAEIIASIYGTRYFGRKIRVESNKVFVDGVKESPDEKLVITGNVSSYVLIVADAQIIAKDIGENCGIYTYNEFGDLILQNLGSNVSIHSRTGLITSEIGENCRISCCAPLIAASIGRRSTIFTNNKVIVTRSEAKTYEIHPIEAIILQTEPQAAPAVTEKSKLDAKACAQHGLFATEREAKKTMLIADFICPITGIFMREPVVYQDGRTYEKSAITAWLIQNGKSPLNPNLVLPQELRTPQCIEKLLVRNISLQGACEEYLRLNPEIREQNPELFPDTGAAAGAAAAVP